MIKVLETLAALGVGNVFHTQSPQKKLCTICRKQKLYSPYEVGTGVCASCERRTRGRVKFPDQDIQG